MIRGGGRNFKRQNVEQPILRNLEIANVKSYEVQLFDFLVTKLFFDFLKIIWTLKFWFFFSNFYVPIFYNFANLIFIEVIFF